MPISLYYGDEAYLLQQALKTLRQTVQNDPLGGLGHKILEKPELSVVLEAIGTVYFNLGGQTLIEVHQLPQLAKAASGHTEEQELAELMELLTQVDDSKHVVFVSDKINRTLKFAKWLTSGKVPVNVREYKSFAFWETDKAVKALLDVCKQKDIAIEPQALQLLVEHQGVHLLPLMTEVEKLSVYAGNRPVTPADVATLSNHNENTFQMLEDWLLRKNRGEVFATLDELLLRQHPLQLLSLTQSWLAHGFQICYWRRGGYTESDLASRTKKHPFRIKKDLELFSRVPFERLDTLRKAVLDYETKSKTGELNAQLALEMLMST